MPDRIIIEVKGMIEEHIDEMVEKGLIIRGRMSRRMSDPDAILKKMGYDHLVGKVNVKIVRTDRTENTTRRDLNKLKRLDKKGMTAEAPSDYNYADFFREVTFEVENKKEALPKIIDHLMENNFEYKV